MRSSEAKIHRCVRVGCPTAATSHFRGGKRLPPPLHNPHRHPRRPRAGQASFRGPAGEVGGSLADVLWGVPDLGDVAGEGAEEGAAGVAHRGGAGGDGDPELHLRHPRRFRPRSPQVQNLGTLDFK